MGLQWQDSDAGCVADPCQSPGAQELWSLCHCWLFPTHLHPLGSLCVQEGKTPMLQGGDRPGHMSRCRTPKDGPGVCRLTKVSSCAPLLFEGCASFRIRGLLPRSNISWVPLKAVLIVVLLIRLAEAPS